MIREDPAGVVVVLAWPRDRGVICDEDNGQCAYSECTMTRHETVQLDTRGVEVGSFYQCWEP